MKIKKTIAAALTVVMLSTAASGVFASGANENISGGINGGAEETQSYLGDNESELLVSPSPGIFDDNEELSLIHICSKLYRGCAPNEANSVCTSQLSLIIDTVGLSIQITLYYTHFFKVWSQPFDACKPHFYTIIL